MHRASSAVHKANPPYFMSQKNLSTIKSQDLCQLSCIHIQWKLSVKLEEMKICTEHEVSEQIRMQVGNPNQRHCRTSRTSPIATTLRRVTLEKRNVLPFLKHFRLENKIATSSLWMCFFMINSVIQGKYGWKLQARLPQNHHGHQGVYWRLQAESGWASLMRGRQVINLN